MSKLPSISGRECAKAIEKMDFYFKRQKGSHMVYRRDEPYAQVIIPDHDTLDKRTLRSIIRDAGLSVEEFVGLL